MIQYFYLITLLNIYFLLVILEVSVCFIILYRSQHSLRWNQRWTTPCGFWQRSLREWNTGANSKIEHPSYSKYLVGLLVSLTIHQSLVSRCALYESVCSFEFFLPFNGLHFFSPGTLDSAVTIGNHGAKTFLLRDGQYAVQCVFYETVSCVTILLEIKCLQAK